MPYCIDSANARPPEYVGGGPGYEDFLEAMPNISECRRLFKYA
ncbi:plasmid pRiA4b ORF-3 family protein [Pseudomonas chlororaphis]|nr:plasmid pRiA4b ORF-3 family protein [Pseudomonas chlororaphis]